MVALLGGCGSDDEATCGPAAAVETFNVTLTKAAEVPVCATAGANATGSATVTISADGCQVQVSNFTFSGLSGTANNAHLHFDVPGMEGPVVFDMGNSPTPPINRTFTSDEYTGGSGKPDTFEEFITMVRAGGHAYLNVHTAACTPGEIRGDLL